MVADQLRLPDRILIVVGIAGLLAVGGPTALAHVDPGCHRFKRRGLRSIRYRLAWCSA
jgi:hypothetical protein